MIEGKGLGDSDILSVTERHQNDEGLVQLRTTLPSGRVVNSEWIRPDDLKAPVLIKWCDFIRGQIDADNAEEEARRKRGSIEGEESGDAEADTESTQDVSETVPERPTADDSPVEWAKRNRDLYQTRVTAIERRIDDLKIEREQLRERLEQWEKVVSALRGEIGED